MEYAKCPLCKNEFLLEYNFDFWVCIECGNTFKKDKVKLCKI